MRSALLAFAMVLSLGATLMPASAAAGGHGGGVSHGGGGFHAGGGFRGPGGFHGEARPGVSHGYGFNDRVAHSYGYGSNLSCGYALNPGCPHLAPG
jgi:hypothetical protein